MASKKRKRHRRRRKQQKNSQLQIQGVDVLVEVAGKDGETVEIIAGGRDMRYSYLAAGIRWMLRGDVQLGDRAYVQDIDVDSLIDHIRAGQTYDPGVVIDVVDRGRLGTTEESRDDWDGGPDRLLVCYVDARDVQRPLRRSFEGVQVRCAIGVAACCNNCGGRVREELPRQFKAYPARSPEVKI